MKSNKYFPEKEGKKNLNYKFINKAYNISYLKSYLIKFFFFIIGIDISKTKSL